MSIKNDYDYLFKYILVGDFSVGKSNILLRFSKNEFSTNYHSTIGIEFSTKSITINNKNLRIQVWDTAGQEKFLGITKNYFKDCCCVLIIYDITNRQTFNNLQNWINTIQNYCNKYITLYMIGNKCDLEEQREVNYEEGEKFAQENNIHFNESSAKENININEIFEECTKIICDNIDKEIYDLNNENIGIKRGKRENIIIGENNNKNNNNKCC